jgi:hypothetical protein
MYSENISVISLTDLNGSDSGIRPNHRSRVHPHIQIYLYIHTYTHRSVGVQRQTHTERRRERYEKIQEYREKREKKEKQPHEKTIIFISKSIDIISFQLPAAARLLQLSIVIQNKRYTYRPTYQHIDASVRYLPAIRH